MQTFVLKNEMAMVVFDMWRHLRLGDEMAVTAAALAYFYANIRNKIRATPLGMRNNLT